MEASIVELEGNHPGFNDGEYRSRRDEIAKLALENNDGDVPDVTYTMTEIDTWKQVYDRLVELYPTHACAQFNEVFTRLGYSRERIPQLAEVSSFLDSNTGFRLRPVAGLVSARLFLSSLGEGVFCATQYIRHHSQPFYTPEPDVVHELMGHAPMLAIPEFAELSRRIGQSSRNATDKEIEQLATLYWFTVEYGLVEQDEQLRAYGAGLLSSFGELEHALSGEVEVRPLDPEVAKDTPYPITEFQPLLWKVESISLAVRQIAEFLG
jgi:phenylalanine-4-hydroxylase